MRTIYEIDKWRVYTGRSKEISERDGRPTNWVDATQPPEGVAQWTGSEWIVLDEYPQPPLDSVYSEAMSRIKAGHAAALSAITDRFPQTEREGWSTLIAQAHEGAGDMIAAYAQGLGVSVAEASARIVTASQTTELMYGQATGILTALRDQVDTAYQAGDVAALQAIVWPE